MLQVATLLPRDLSQRFLAFFVKLLFQFERQQMISFHGLPFLLLITLTYLLVLPLQTITALPDGFIDEAVGKMPATHGRFAPNPRQNGKPMLMIASIVGQFFVVEDPDNSGPRMDIGNMESILCGNGPRGVLGFVPHPDFLTNPYIYVYYTRIAPGCVADSINGPSQRLSRFSIDPVTLQLQLNSELVFLETPPQIYLIHAGGAIAIGNDNHIYLCIGDGGYINTKFSQSLDFLYSKLIRLDLDGNVPPSNPYTVASGGKGVPCRHNKGVPPAGSPVGSVCEEIYAYGLRNPFKMGVDMNVVDTVRFAIGDVGNSLWEEASFGGTDYKGANYGWSAYEGPCRLNSGSNCPLQGQTNTEPFYYYLHRNGGGAITGSVFVPNGIWPPQYKYMIIEYIEGLLLNIVDDESVGCRTCIPPRPSYRNETFHEYERMVDVFFGPYKNTQAMYYLSRAGGDNVRRIRYIGGTNRPPKAIISPLNPMYQVNETISFGGSSSTDADGDSLMYFWKFGLEQTSSLPDPVVSYTKAGWYSIELTVTDTIGLTSRATTTITVGMPPTATIEFPPDGYEFLVGELIQLKGSGVDSFNQLLPASQLFWEVNIHHAFHFHPFMGQRPGNDFTTSAAPDPEDFMAATNSSLQIVLTTVDSMGLSTTVHRNINPRKIFIDIDSNVPGRQVLVGDFAITTPSTITTWQNQILKLEASDQDQYVFQSWSIGGGRVTNYTVLAPNNTNPEIIVNFVPTVAPVSIAPVSVAPVSVAPVSVAPVSVAPVSVAPVSIAPVSAAPVKIPSPVVAPVVPPSIVINCTVLRWDLFNSLTDQFVTTLTEGAIVQTPPPCNMSNIEAVSSCGTEVKIISVILELYKSNNKLFIRKNEGRAPFFLYGNTGRNINNGWIPVGAYRIRGTVNGIVGSFTTFTMGGSCK